MIKLSITLVFFFVTFWSFAQIIEPPKTAQVKALFKDLEQIAQDIIDPSIKTNVASWYEGEDLEEVIKIIAEHEARIGATELEVIYALDAMFENPAYISLAFVNESTNKLFGHFYIVYKDFDNNLVDEIQFDKID